MTPKRWSFETPAEQLILSFIMNYEICQHSSLQHPSPDFQMACNYETAMLLNP